MEPRAGWGAAAVLGAILAAGAWSGAAPEAPQPGCGDGSLRELRGPSDDGGAFGPSWLVCRGHLGAALERIGCSGVTPPDGEAVAVDEACRAWRVAPSARTSLLLGRPVAINEAARDDLEVLPGIGPGLARRIVATRERDGPFAGLDDLRRVRGIGSSRIRALEGWAVAGGARAR